MMQQHWRPAIFKSLKLAMIFASLVSTTCFAQVGNDKALKLSFADTDVSVALKGLTLKTNANIVYSNQTKIPITLNVAVNTVEDALRSITSAAGLSYRRVGDVYVVAAAKDMRQALEPYMYRSRFTPKGVAPSVIAKLFTDNLPHANVQEQGDYVSVTAVPQDINLASDLLKEAEVRASLMKAGDRVLAVKYVKPEDVVKLSAAMFKDLKVVAVGDGSATGANSVMVTGPVGEIDRLAKVIAEIDEPTQPKTLIDYQVYNLRFTSAPAVKAFLKEASPNVEVVIAPEPYAPLKPKFETISGASVGQSSNSGSGGGSGGNQQQSQGGQGGQTQTQKPYKEGDFATTIVLKGPSDEVRNSLRLLEQLDVRPKQLMIEVRVVETSPDMSEQLGFRWSWTRFGFYEAAAGTAVSAGAGGIGNDFTTFNTRPLSFGQLSRVPFSFQAFLDAQILSKEAKLLASPSISVIDNNDATIFIGDTIRARVSQASGLGGQTVEIMEFPVGIILLVRPRINADGVITMRVNPVISTVTALDPNNVPQTSTREADTTVMCRDGETIVIGGLIRDEFSKIVQAVPFLSDLPIVGQLFRNRSTTRRRTDVLVTITPRIVDLDRLPPLPAEAVKKAGDKL